MGIGGYDDGKYYLSVGSYAYYFSRKEDVSGLAADNTVFPGLEIVTRNWFNVNLDYKYYSLVSLMAMLSMVIVLLLVLRKERIVGK